MRTVEIQKLSSWLAAFQNLPKKTTHLIDQIYAAKARQVAFVPVKNIAILPDTTCTFMADLFSWRVIGGTELLRYSFDCFIRPE
ncbi:MAG TPA: hypothetical protein DHK64_10555 [Rhodobiaceae bacterium]|nr:hypothetical protein [Rhodobiaceae bacterium]